MERSFGNPGPVPRATPAQPDFRGVVTPQTRPLQSRPAVVGMDGLIRPQPMVRSGAALSRPEVIAQQMTDLRAVPQQYAAQPTALPQVYANAPQPSEQPAAPRRHLPPIDMELPGEESPTRLGFARTIKWQRARRWAVRGTALTAVLVITLGGLFFSQNYLKLHKAFSGTAGTAAALKNNVTPDMLKGEGSGRINILLLGRGGGSHDGPDLTDTMMLASIDPVNHEESLVSIPRDLWVTVPDGGAMKINAAWETGEFNYEGKIAPGSTDPKAIQAGFNSVDQVVQNVLGVNVDYNVLVDFQAFQQAVDTVGGVTVNVPNDLVDPTMAWENGNNPVLAQAGTQNFNGKQALLYVRSRETSSDFARAERQRAVLLALKTKVETLGTLSDPMKISGLVSAFGNNVSTDLSLSNGERLYSIIKQINNSNTNSVDLAGDVGSTATGAGTSSTGQAATSYVTTGNMNGQSIVLPTAGLFDYSQIQAYIRSQLKDPYILKENAKILILNGTSTPGMAENEETLLKSYGYNVMSVGNTPTSDWSQTTLVNLTHKDKYTQHYLEERLGVTAQTSLQDKSIATGNADFVIIIGDDQATSTQTPAN